MYINKENEHSSQKPHYGPVLNLKKDVPRRLHVEVLMSPEQEAKEDAEIPQVDRPDFDYFEYIPMAKAHLDDGGGAFVLSEESKDYYAFRKDWLNKITTGMKNLILIRVKGPSMEPTIGDDDIVMLDKGRKRIYDGCIYAIGLGGLIYIKRMMPLGAGGTVRIISDNPNFPNEDIDPCDLRILGQVIWFARELIK